MGKVVCVAATEEAGWSFGQACVSAQMSHQVAEALAAHCSYCRRFQSECSTFVTATVNDTTVLTHLTCQLQSLACTHLTHHYLIVIATAVTAACQVWKLLAATEHTNVLVQLHGSVPFAMSSFCVCMHRVCKSSSWRWYPCSAGISWCYTNEKSILRCLAAACEPGRHMCTGCSCSDSCCWNRWPSDR